MGWPIRRRDGRRTSRHSSSFCLRIGVSGSCCLHFAAIAPESIREPVDGVSGDLCRLAGLKPMAVLIEIMNDDGSMSRVPDLVKFGKQHGLNLYTVADTPT